MAKFKINKAKLIKNDHLSLNYRITEDDGTEASISNDHQRPAHADLKAAFNALSPHFAILTGCIKPKQINDVELIKEFHATGIHLKGDEGFVISGYRSLENGTVAFPTPFTRYEGENAYQLIEAVETSIAKLKEEILLYITEGKRAPESQPELPFLLEDNVTHAQIAEPDIKRIPVADKEAMARVADGDKEDKAIEKPKGKGGRKKVAQSADVPSGEVEE